MNSKEKDLKIRELEAALSNGVRESLKTYHKWYGRARTLEFMFNAQDKNGIKLNREIANKNKSLVMMLSILEKNKIHTTHCPNCGSVQANNDIRSYDRLCPNCMDQIKDPWIEDCYGLAK